MFLKKLSLANFKNYGTAELEFSARINCFTGNNGVGKTNILDAINYLSLTKSFFNSSDSLNIKHNEEYFILRGQFERDGIDDNILCSFQRSKQKVLKRNGKEYQRLSDHVGRYPVVMISPSDSVLISEGSEERRKFMNRIIIQYSPEYLDCLMKYNKALQQRNKLLRSFRESGSFDGEMLSVWDSQLVRYGSVVHEERRSLVEELIPVFKEYYQLISGGREDVSLSYSSHLNQGSFTQALTDAIAKDRALEYTTAGIHRDDLILEMNGHPVRSIGSQGQQKSYLVALKLAKFDFIRQKAGFAPVLLLDDIFDKFDADRVEQIIKLVGNHRFGQIFITDTHEERLKEILVTHNFDYRFFRIGEKGIEEKGVRHEAEEKA